MSMINNHFGQLVSTPITKSLRHQLTTKSKLGSRFLTSTVASQSTVGPESKPTASALQRGGKSSVSAEIVSDRLSLPQQNQKFALRTAEARSRELERRPQLLRRTQAGTPRLWRPWRSAKGYRIRRVETDPDIQTSRPSWRGEQDQRSGKPASEAEVDDLTWKWRDDQVKLSDGLAVEFATELSGALSASCYDFLHHWWPRALEKRGWHSPHVADLADYAQLIADVQLHLPRHSYELERKTWDGSPLPSLPSLSRPLKDAVRARDRVTTAGDHSLRALHKLCKLSMVAVRALKDTRGENGVSMLAKALTAQFEHTRIAFHRLHVAARQEEDEIASNRAKFESSQYSDDLYSDALRAISDRLSVQQEDVQHNLASHLRRALAKHRDWQRETRRRPNVFYPRPVRERHAHMQTRRDRIVWLLRRAKTRAEKTGLPVEYYVLSDATLRSIKMIHAQAAKSWDKASTALSHEALLKETIDAWTKVSAESQQSKRTGEDEPDQDMTGKKAKEVARKLRKKLSLEDVKEVAAAMEQVVAEDLDWFEELSEGDGKAEAPRQQTRREEIDEDAALLHEIDRSLADAGEQLSSYRGSLSRLDAMLETRKRRRLGSSQSLRKDELAKESSRKPAGKAANSKAAAIEDGSRNTRPIEGESDGSSGQVADDKREVRDTGKKKAQETRLEKINTDKKGQGARLEKTNTGKKRQETRLEETNTGNKGQETRIEKTNTGKKGQETRIEKTNMGKKGRETRIEKTNMGERKSYYALFMAFVTKLWFNRS